MEATTISTKAQRLKVGGPLGILLVMDSPPLLLRMADTVRSMEGVRLLGTFGSLPQVVDWVVWNHEPWHYAFVDLALPQGASDELIERLLTQPRAGHVVAIGDHLWREVREKCAGLGVTDLLEKGDVIAFRSFLEAKVA
jgi:DNA-binding NarL/FixJ family response regulator